MSQKIEKSQAADPPEAEVELTDEERIARRKAALLAFGLPDDTRLPRTEDDDAADS